LIENIKRRKGNIKLNTRVALYTRVSTDEQAEKGTSLQTQLERLREYAKAMKYPVIGEYIDDGESGANEERPALNKLRSDAKGNKFDAILVFKLDRFARSLPILVKLVREEFEQLNISFISITESFDTSSPFGKAVLGILGTFAEFELEQIRERNIRGKRKKASEGKLVSHWVQYGYMKSKDGKKNIEINPIEEKIVKDIFDWYLKGMSVRDIAKKLSAKGVKPKRKIGPWGLTTIKRILKCKFYTGIGTWGKPSTNKNRKRKHNLPIIEFQTPRLISNDIFMQVQQKLDVNKSNTHPKTQHFFLLRRLLECKRCNHKLLGEPKSSKHRANYRCRSGRINIRGEKSHLKAVKMSMADEIVWERVKKWITDTDTLREIINRGRPVQKVQDVTLEVQKRNQIELIEKKSQAIQRLYGLFADEQISTAEALSKEITQRETELKSMKDEFDSIESEIRKQNRIKEAASDIETYVLGFRDKILKMSNEDKRKLMLKLVEKIEVTWNPERERHGFIIFPKFNLSAIKRNVPNRPIKPPKVSSPK